MHLTIAYILCRIVGLNYKYRVLFLIGALMPDFERLMSLIGIVIGSIRVELFFIKMLTQPFHSIFGVFLLSGFLGSFFPNEPPIKTYVLLFAGGLLHLFLDIMMWPWGAGYPLLFPLKGAKYIYNLGLIWPGDITLSVIIGIPISLLMIYDRIKDGTLPNKTD